ncbi:homing endonuclease [Acinetobacter phage Morttis]|nr:homing endonuclease [Acinetobacter phage Maestro]QQM18682.1 homing endonuclease [Acinetobacter phage Morttis]
MNYKRIYDELINNALNRASVKSKAAPGELETHHIVPKCIGGTNDTTNLVNLTTREHIIAHLLLAKIHGGKLVRAAMAMHMGALYINRHEAWQQYEVSFQNNERNK